MRDIALTVVFGLLALMLFKHPVIGAYLWAWISLMNPHQATWGFARSIPFGQIAAVLTILALFASAKKRQALPLNAITVFWLALVLWLAITSLFALNQRGVVFDRWLFVFKIHLMLFVSLMLIINEKQLRILVVVVSLSVAFYGIKGGAFTVLTGGAYRVYGPPGGMLAGNNEAAVGFVMLVPYLYWMRECVRQYWLRVLLAMCMVLMVFSILGTQSRGALIAVLAMVFFLAMKSRYPWRASFVMLLLMVVAIVFMPSGWVERMDTIGDFRSDESAMSRLWTWTTLWNAAVDRPLVGAGFRADTIEIFQLYAPVGGMFADFQFDRAWVAHSVYFQMLGEHGFMGLFLFLGLWVAVWVQAGRLAKRAGLVPAFSAWMPLLMRMTQVSLVGYAAGGAFLSLAYLDLPYYMMGYVIIARILLDREAAKQVPGHAVFTGQAVIGATGVGGLR